MRALPVLVPILGLLCATARGQIALESCDVMVGPWQEVGGTDLSVFSCKTTLDLYLKSTLNDTVPPLPSTLNRTEIDAAIQGSGIPQAANWRVATQRESPSKSTRPPVLLTELTDFQPITPSSPALQILASTSSAPGTVTSASSATECSLCKGASTTSRWTISTHCHPPKTH
jgi:hypothetical protein